MKEEIFSINDTDKVKEFLERKRNEAAKKEMEARKEVEEKIQALKELCATHMTMGKPIYFSDGMRVNKFF